MTNERVVKISNEPNSIPVIIRNRNTNQVQSNDSDDGVLAEYRYLFFVLLKRWWIVALIAIFSGTVAAVYSYFFATPVYKSDTTLFLYRKTDQINSLTSELNAGAQLVKDSLIIIKSESVGEIAVQKLASTIKPTPGALIGKVTATSGMDTRIIKISVQDSNPADAAAYANAVADAFVERFDKIINVGGFDRVDFVQVIDKAKPVFSPIKPNKPLNISIAIFVGALAGIGLLFVLEKMNNTLKSPEKVKMVSGLDVLGAIMLFEENN